MLYFLYLVFIGALVGYSAYIWLLQNTTPAKAATYAYVIPVVAVFLGWALAAEPGRLDELWPDLTKIAIDHAVAEPAAAAGRVAVVPATFGWDDVGDFDSLAGLLEAHSASAAGPAAAAGLSLIGDPADLVSVDSTGLVVARAGRLVALIGVDDLVVVDTPDALLVVPRSRAQEVKGIVDRLAGIDRDHLR